MKWILHWVVIAFIALCLFSDLALASSYCPYTRQDLIKVTGSNIDQLIKLRKLITEYPSLHIKPWIHPHGADTPALYMAPSDVADYFVDQAKEWGLKAYVVMRNVQSRILDQPDPKDWYALREKYAYVDPREGRHAFRYRQSPEDFRLDEFHPLDEINSNKYNETRGIFIDAAMHAREWLSTSTALYMAHQLLSKYRDDTEIRTLVDNITWYIVPVVNVDGYNYTWTSDRYWRRSRSEPKPHDNFTNCKGTAQCKCRGVDLNRNWDTKWNTSDACWHFCCNTFPGVRPMSEPEVQALAKTLKSAENDIQAYISLHSYGQLWMYPYGYEKGLYPDDVSDLHEVAVMAVEAVNQGKGNGTKNYTASSIGDVMYEYSGGSQDWVKNHTKIKYSYVVELRPPGFDGKVAGHFCPDFNQIKPTGEEIFRGIRVVADVLLGKRKLTGEQWRQKLYGTDNGSYNDFNLKFWLSITMIVALLRNVIQ